MLTTPWERRPGYWLRDTSADVFAAVWMRSPDSWAWEVSDDALNFPECAVDFGVSPTQQQAMTDADAALERYMSAPPKEW